MTQRVLSLHIGFIFVRAAVACSVLERTSGFEPSSETLVKDTWSLSCPKLLPFKRDLPLDLWMPLALCVISFVFSALSPFYALCSLSRLSTRVLSFALLQQSINSHGQTQIGNGFFRYFHHVLSRASDIILRENVEGGWKEDILVWLQLLFEPFACAAIHLNCTYSIGTYCAHLAN